MGYRVQGVVYIPEDDLYRFFQNYVPSDGEMAVNQESVQMVDGELAFEFVVNTYCHPNDEAKEIEWKGISNV